MFTDISFSRGCYKFIGRNSIVDIHWLFDGVSIQCSSSPELLDIQMDDGEMRRNGFIPQPRTEVSSKKKKI